MRTKSILPGLALTLSCICCLAQEEAVYRQNVRRDDVNFFRALKGTKGVLTLDADFISFDAQLKRVKDLNFKVAYDEIVKVKRYRGLLLPNRIGFQTAGRTYRIFTYRRKRIIDIIESKSGSKNN